MPDHGKYTLEEFMTRLAAVEEKFAHELRTVIECFSQSRLDLPAKKLDEIGKVRLKAAKHLKKLDKKKTDPLNLWKICNIYSVCAVDTDNAMREVRKSLRKIIVKNEKEEKEKAQKEYQLTVNGNQYTPTRKLGDDYRPQSFLSVLTNRGKGLAKQKASPPERPPLPVRAPSPIFIQLRPDEGFQEPEIYDKHKPTPEEADRMLSVWRKSIDGFPEEPSITAPVSTTMGPDKPQVPSRPPIDSRSIQGPRPQPSPRPRPPNQYTKTTPAPPPPTLPPSADPSTNESIKVAYPLPKPDYESEEKPRSRKNTLENSIKGKSSKIPFDEGPVAQKRASVKKHFDSTSTQPRPTSVASISTINNQNQFHSTAPPQMNGKEPQKDIEKSNEKTRPIVAPRRPQILMGESTPGRPMLRATIVTQQPQQPQQQTENDEFKLIIKHLNSYNQQKVIKF